MCIFIFILKFMIIDNMNILLIINTSPPLFAAASRAGGRSLAGAEWSWLVERHKTHTEVVAVVDRWFVADKLVAVVVAGRSLVVGTLGILDTLGTPGTQAPEIERQGTGKEQVGWSSSTVRGNTHYYPSGSWS